MRWQFSCNVVVLTFFVLIGCRQERLNAAVSDEVLKLHPEQASLFARMALRGIQKPYPHKPGEVWNDDADVRAPRALHPAFYGSYDWHSSVHGHWMLVRLLRLFPLLPENVEIRRVLALHLSAKNLLAEAEAFKRPNSQSFERPYGWAWLLKLAEELHTWEDADARIWERNLQPVTDIVAARCLSYFPKQAYPIRSGVHSNTAFGLAFAIDYAQVAGKRDLLEVLKERGRTYFGKDVDIPARWEPDGADFFSPSLMEADLMRRILPAPEYRKWLANFLPALTKNELKSLLHPPSVTDRSDPQIVHLDGLSLSRAWCMRNIAAALGPDDPASKVLAASAVRHAQAGLAHVSSGDYAGEHWLASFAVYLYSTPDTVGRP